MTAVANTQGFFRIDEGEPHTGVLHVSQEMLRLATLGPRADPEWSFRDRWGHFHAYSITGDRYPTLFEEHYQCESEHMDGDGWWCECRTDYRCRICREVVQPGMIPGPHTDVRPGLSSWTATVHMDCLECPLPVVGAMVTLEVGLPDCTRFGVAVVSGLEVSKPVSGRRHTEVTLTGAGPLGSRGKR